MIQSTNDLWVYLLIKENAISHIVCSVFLFFMDKCYYSYSFFYFWHHIVWTIFLWGSKGFKIKLLIERHCYFIVMLGIWIWFLSWLLKNKEQKWPGSWVLLPLILTCSFRPIIFIIMEFHGRISSLPKIHFPINWWP